MTRKPLKVMPEVADQEWKEGGNHSGVFRQEITWNFIKTLLIKLQRFRFWRFGHWMEVLVDDFLPFRWTYMWAFSLMLRCTFTLIPTLTETEARCSLTAGTRGNGNAICQPIVSETVIMTNALLLDGPSQVGSTSGEGLCKAARVLPGVGRWQPLRCTCWLYRRGEY